PTDRVALVGRRLERRLLELLLERGQRTFRHAPPSIVVDEPVPQHPVEPRGDALLRLQWHPVHAAGERLLEEVLRSLAMAHPSLEEGEERIPVLGHGREELTAGGRAHREALEPMLRITFRAHRSTLPSDERSERISSAVASSAATVRTWFQPVHPDR